MANHAGFGGVLTISTTFAQQILHAYYSSDNVTPILQSESPLKLLAKTDNNNIPLPDRYLSYDLFMAEPILDFTPREDDKISIFIRLSGTLTFSTDPEFALPTIDSNVQIDFTIPANVRTFDNGEQISFGITFDSCFIETYQAKVFNGTDPKTDYLFDVNVDLKSFIQLAIFGLDTSTWRITPPGFDEIKSLGLSVSEFPEIKLFDVALTIAIDVVGETSGNQDFVIDLLNSSLEKGYITTFSDTIHQFDDEYGEPIYDTGFTATTKRQAGPHNLCQIAFAVNGTIINMLYEGVWRQLILDAFEAQKAQEIADALAEALEKNEDYDEPDIANIEITDINLSLEDSHIFVSGDADYSGIGVSFSFSIRVVKINVDGSTQFVYDNQQMNGMRGEVFDVDINLPGWVVFLQALVGTLGIVLAPFTGMISALIALMLEVTIGAILTNVTENAEGDIKNDIMNQLASFNSTFTFTLPNTESPEITVRPNDIVVKANGLSTWFTATVDYGKYTELIISGNNNSTIWSVHNRNPIVIKFSAPEGLYHPDDEMVKIRWTVFAEHTGNKIIETDEPIKRKLLSTHIPTHCKIDHAKTEWDAFEKYIVRCRVYRPWGVTTQEIYYKEIVITIADRLHRDQPFVRWETAVFYKGYTAKLKDENRQALGWVNEKRKSQIHKTDPDERCRYADGYTTKLTKDDLTYMDNLPFDEADIKLHLNEICEFCFFGGPDKVNPKPKIPKDEAPGKKPHVPDHFKKKRPFH